MTAMTARRDFLAVLLLFAAAPSGLAASEAASFVEAAKLTGSDTAAGDEFGTSVAVDGDVLIAGAWFDDDRGPASGSAYVFERLGGSPGSWQQTAKLTAPDGLTSDYFGGNVAIAGDTALVTASVNDHARSGYAYLFGRDAGGPGAWGVVAKLQAADGEPDDGFGGAAAISGDTAVVGAAFADLPGRIGGGAVYVYERDAGGPDQWGQVAKLTPASGCKEIPKPAYCGWWDSGFGGSISISGDTLLVGGNTGIGYGYVFERAPGEPDGWRRVSRLIPDQWAPAFGIGMAIGGETIWAGSYSDHDLGALAGAAFLFEPDPEIPYGWRQTAKIKARDGAEGDEFGVAVAVSGETAVIGAPQLGMPYQDGRGQAYVFRRDGGSSAPWRQIAKLLPAGLEPYDAFSHGSVAVSRETIVVGAYGDDDRGSSAGAVYVFQETRVDPALAISGSCPGRVTVNATGLTPRGEVEVYRSSAEGSFVLPGGPCVGIALGLGEAQLVAPPLRLDGSGGFALTPILPEAACGSYLQLVDLTSCALSGVEPVP